MQLVKPEQSYEPLERLLMGGLVAKAIVESIRLGIYDLLETPCTAEEVADAKGMALSATEVLLDLLACHGLVAKHCDGYKNTKRSAEYLVSSSPFYQGASIGLSEDHYSYVSENMQELIKKPGQRRCDIGKMFVSGSKMEGMIQYAMRGSLQDTVEFITSLPNFQDLRSMCDVGGGHGQYSMELLNHNIHLESVIADLPIVIPETEMMIQKKGYSDRISTMICDLRSETLPYGIYDLVFVSHVLQLFGSDLAAVIEKIGACVQPGGWFVSQHMDPGGGAADAYKTGMNMMSCCMAQINHFINREEMEHALTRAGFGDMISGRSGPKGQNMILAGRKI